jgi:hypothetical protein
MKTKADPFGSVDVSAAVQKLQEKKKPSFFRKNKYNSAPKEERTWQDKVYDSKLEMRMHQELLKSFSPEEILTQVRFELQPSYCLDFSPEKQRAINYVADFVIGEVRQDERGNNIPGRNCMVVDAKGMVTSSFVTASKLFEYKFRIPVHAVKTIKKLQSIINQRMKSKEIDSKFIKASTPGTKFQVKGYKNSSGEEGDMTLRVIGREGYVELNKKSLDLLEATAAKLIEGTSDEDLEICHSAIKAVKTSLEKAIGMVEENTCGARLVTERISKEDLQQITPDLVMVDGDPDKLAFMRLEVIDYVPILSVPQKQAKKTVTALRRILEAALPIGSYRHRINLYPGKYQSLDLLP